MGRINKKKLMKKGKKEYITANFLVFLYEDQQEERRI
jgi:hypothetical protein|tara:strand:- start:31 stop:141 length:111 start_codon:yes stop_codon:yes gene_type:complete